MQDIESYGISNKSKLELLRDRLVAYMAVMFTLLSLVFSCIGLNMGRQSNLEKTLYTFSFPYFNQVPKVQPGMVVSLDQRGYVFTGAGTTISLNVTRAKAYSFEDIRVCAFSNNVIFAGSVGKLVAYEISYDDISLENEVYDLPRVGNEPRKVEALYKFGDDTLVVVGSGQLLPIFVKITEVNAKNYKIEYVPGVPFTFSEVTKESYAHCDELHDMSRSDMMACTWEEGMELWTMLAVLEGKGQSKQFRLMDKKPYGIARKFHGLAGCGPSGYLVATVGPRKNNTEHEVGRIRVAYVEIQRDHKLRVSNFTDLDFEYSLGFFTLDNYYMNGAVMCYTRAASGGINCVNINVEHGPFGGIRFGSTVTVSKGGSAISEERAKMQIINQSTFALLWADQNIGGALSYQMVNINDEGDLVKSGPAYVISQRRRSGNVYQHIVGCSSVDFYKSFIVELVQNDQGGAAYLHTVYVYPRPIGIAAKTFAGANQVQFGGVWKVSDKALALIRDKKLKPGRMYYTNDRGMILEGPPAGYAHRSFGIQYVTSRSDQSLLALGNRVGMAINEKQLLLKFY